MSDPETMEKDDSTMVTRNAHPTNQRTRLRFQAFTVVVALLLLVGALPAAAIVYVMPTDESMVDRSPIIVFGEVLSAQPGTVLDSPTTDYLFAVDEVLKGFVPGSAIMVRQPGGVVADGTAMTVMGLPMLAEGNRVLLFLHREENGAHAIVEYGLGMFFEARIGDRVFLLREPSLQGEVVLPGGSAVSDRVRRRGWRDGEAFKRWIADRAAGVERPFDYLAAELPESPTAVASPFRLLQWDCDGAAETLPRRWREFDRGESVGFEVHSRGQPGIAGGGLSLVRAAMRLWNADRGSNVDLRFAGTTAVAPRQLVFHGVNSITFDDPHDEIEGTFDYDEGGALATAVTWDHCGAAHNAGGLRAREIPQANITTQDGSQSYFRRFDSGTAERSFQNLMAHELGHALGIQHPCEKEETGCDATHEYREAVMWWHNDPNRDLGTALHDDDRAAVRRLYPDGTGPDRTPTAPGNLSGEALNPTVIKLTWIDRSDNEAGFEINTRAEGDSGWSGMHTRPANATSIALHWTIPPATKRWQFRVGAFNDYGKAYSNTATVTLPELGEEEPAPDLVVESPRSTTTSVAPGGIFRFAATVRNRGDARSSATTLRYYRSTDSTITTSDTQVGTDPIGALSSSGTDRQSIGQRAPATGGTYYYGACVDVVAGESDTTNNCSSGVRVTVGNGGGMSGADLVVESPRSTESAVALGGTFRFAATVRNRGDARSSATTLRYYRSTDSTIATSDTQVGTDPIGALSSSGTDRQSIGQRAPATDGTYYYGACVDVVASESNRTNNCSVGVRVTVGSGGGGMSGADLVVESPRSTESAVALGGTFRFAATVRNRGDARSSATTLRYYRSTDSTITTSDTQVGTDPIGALSSSGTDRQSIGQRAPATDGTYYYGACVDVVAGESDNTNNCSSGVRVTVGDGGGGMSGADLVVESPRSTESAVALGATFRFAATVRNRGDARSSATTLRYYRSTDSTITTSDTQVGTDPIGVLSSSGTDRQSIGQRAPATDGTYYYGACVDVVAGESDTTNNCSSAVPVAVGGGVDDVVDTGFDLEPDNGNAKGIVYAQGRFYIVDGGDNKVYAYRASDGRRDAAADFDLDSYNRYAEGITYGQDRFYVVDWLDEKVYAYRASDGRRDAAADFDLDFNGSPRGITYGQDRFYVVDWSDEKVYAYRASDGRRDAAAGFDLDFNGSPRGITYGQDRFYVVDWSGEKVYAYGASDGRRDAAADFDLDFDNRFAEGIAYRSGKVFVVNDYEDNVRAYSVDGSGGGRTDDHGDTLADATSIAVPSTTAGELENGGDNDYFRLVVDQSTTLTVETTGSTDTYGTLFDSSGASQESDDDDGAGTNFKIERDVGAGTYYVNVRGYSSTATGRYELRVSTSGTGGGSGPDLGNCRANLVVNPGQTCTYKGHTFRVSSDGRGSIAFFNAGTSIDARGSTINGVRWNFYASRNTGSNSWTIHVAD